MEGSHKWQAVEAKLSELQKIVEENWGKGEWELAIQGESTIRTVEQSKASAALMRQQAGDLISTISAIEATRLD